MWLAVQDLDSLRKNRNCGVQATFCSVLRACCSLAPYYGKLVLFKYLCHLDLFLISCKYLVPAPGYSKAIPKALLAAAS